MNIWRVSVQDTKTSWCFLEWKGWCPYYLGVSGWTPPRGQRKLIHSEVFEPRKHWILARRSRTLHGMAYRLCGLTRLLSRIQILESCMTRRKPRSEIWVLDCTEVSFSSHSISDCLPTYDKGEVETRRRYLCHLRSRSLSAPSCFATGWIVNTYSRPRSRLSAWAIQHQQYWKESGYDPIDLLNVR